MPGKSRHKKRKIAQSKRDKRRQVIQSMAQPQAAAQEQKPVAPAEVVRPVSKPTPATQVIASQQQYVAGEMKRIGILTLIMTAVLVILSFVLH